jgi:hypothetical protein
MELGLRKRLSSVPRSSEGGSGNGCRRSFVFQIARGPAQVVLLDFKFADDHLIAFQPDPLEGFHSLFQAAQQSFQDLGGRQFARRWHRRSIFAFCSPMQELSKLSSLAAIWPGLESGSGEELMCVPAGLWHPNQ